MFNKDSGLVKIWVRLLTQKNGKYTTDDIPSISNLRDVVLSEISDIKQFKCINRGKNMACKTRGTKKKSTKKGK